MGRRPRRSRGTPGPWARTERENERRCCDEHEHYPPWYVHPASFPRGLISGLRGPARPRIAPALQGENGQGAEERRQRQDDAGAAYAERARDRAVGETCD